MLALKYRPSKLDEVVGQKAVSSILAAMIKKNMVPNALLFAGPRGTGKTSTARILAQAILERQGADNSDVAEVDAASHGGVEDIRRLQETVYFSGTRIIILDEAHSMSREAFNALLKLMEEPPSHATFILVTTEPGRIPDTIKSRCMQFDFKRLSPKDIYERLVFVVDAEDRADIEPEVLEYISFKADGGMRDALMLLDQALRSEIRTVEQYRDFFGELDSGPLLISACIKSQTEAITTVRLLLSFLPAEEIIDNAVSALSDSILLREGIPIPRSGTAYEVRKELSASLDAGQTAKILRILWNLKSQRREHVSGSFLELAAVMIAEIFNEIPAVQIAAKRTIAVPPALKTSLNDFKNL